MNSWFIALLSLSLGGTVLILLLLLFKLFYKRRLSKRWQYYIWLIVIARLILPLSPEKSLVESWFSDIRADVVAPVLDAYLGNDSQVPAKADYLKAAASSDDSEISAVNQPDPRRPEEFPGIRIVWLAGVMLLLIRKITVYQSKALHCSPRVLPVTV